MKYFKTNKHIKNKYFLVLFFVLIIFFSLFIIKDILSRSIFTITAGSLYIEFLNEKAEFINFVKQIQKEP